MTFLNFLKEDIEVIVDNYIDTNVKDKCGLITKEHVKLFSLVIKNINNYAYIKQLKDNPLLYSGKEGCRIILTSIVSRILTAFYIIQNYLTTS